MKCNYKQKTERGNFASSNMDAAVNLVIEKGNSYRQATRQFDKIDFKTLGQYDL